MKPNGNEEKRKTRMQRRHWNSLGWNVKKISAWMWFLNIYLKHLRAKIKPNALRVQRLAKPSKTFSWFHARVHLMCFFWVDKNKWYRVSFRHNLMWNFKYYILTIFMNYKKSIGWLVCKVKHSISESDYMGGKSL
jgi:hypothetical protein